MSRASGPTDKNPSKINGHSRPKLHLKAGTWLGCRVASRQLVSEDGRPSRPDLLAWLEEDSGQLLVCTLCLADAPDQVLADSLVAAMEKPLMGSARRPTQVIVADELEARVLRADPRLSDVIVRVGPVPALWQVIEQMEEHFAPDDEPHSYLEDDADGLLVNAFFHSAADFYKMAPWALVDREEQVIEVDLGPDKRYCAVIIGSLGEHFGLVLYQSTDDYLHFSRISMMSGPEALEPGDMDGSFLSVNFDRAEDLPAGLVEEAMAKGWRPAGPAAWPILIEARDGPPVLSFRAEALVDASAAMQAMVLFLEEHSGLFSQSDPTPVQLTVHTTIAGNRRTVRVSAPHPEVSWESDNDEDWSSGFAINPHDAPRFLHVIEMYLEVLAGELGATSLRRHQTVLQLLIAYVDVAGAEILTEVLGESIDSLLGDPSDAAGDERFSERLPLPLIVPILPAFCFDFMPANERRSTIIKTVPAALSRFAEFCVERGFINFEVAIAMQVLSSAQD